MTLLKSSTAASASPDAAVDSFARGVASHASAGSATGLAPGRRENEQVQASRDDLCTEHARAVLVGSDAYAGSKSAGSRRRGPRQHLRPVPFASSPLATEPGVCSTTD